MSFLFAKEEDFNALLRSYFAKIVLHKEKLVAALNRKTEIEAVVSAIILDLDELNMKNIHTRFVSKMIQEFREKTIETGESELRSNLAAIQSQKIQLDNDATSLLNRWFLDHLCHPFPTSSEKEYLSYATGLSKNQVSNWFINTRGRRWKKHVEEKTVHECVFEKKEITRQIK